jgi:hypothetical protein
MRTAPVTHQTAELSPGRHRNPAHGVCVMELSSMLGGEPFSDRPACVDPVIAAFLRVYNDAATRRRRQDLYAYAAAVVGTAGDRDATRARARLCVALGRDVRGRRRPSLGWLRPVGTGVRAAERAAEALALRTDPAEHSRALAFLDLLLAVGRPTSVLPDPPPQRGPADTPLASATAAR